MSLSKKGPAGPSFPTGPGGSPTVIRPVDTGLSTKVAGVNPEGAVVQAKTVAKATGLTGTPSKAQLQSVAEGKAELSSGVVIRGRIGGEETLNPPASGVLMTTRTLVDVTMEGDDAYNARSPGIALTFQVLGTNAEIETALSGARKILALVDFGAAGIGNGSAATVEVTHGQTIVVPGSYARVQMQFLSAGTIPIRLGCFAGVPYANRIEPAVSSDEFSLLVAQTQTEPVAPFADRFKVITSSATASIVTELLDPFGTVVYAFTGPQLEWQPITGSARNFRVRNIGIAPTGNISLIQGVEF